MRILVIRGGAIGDFLVTLPAIQSLRRLRPDASIHLLGRPAVRALATLGGACDGFTSLEEGRFAALHRPGPPDGLAPFFEPFDWVVSYLHDPDGTVGEALTALGFDPGTAFAPPPGRRLWIHGDPMIRTAPAALQLAEPVQILGGTLDDPLGTLALPDEAIREAERLWGDGDTGVRIAVHPGSGSPSKNWPAGRWCALLERIGAEIPHARILVLGGEADGPALERLRGKGPWRCHTPGDLTATAALLAQADRFLGHDSGIGHLAAVMGTRALLLFGPTDPAVWAPPTPRAEVLRSETGRMEDIPVDEVWQAARRFLAS
jgi:heptosyltransferase-2